MNLSSIFLPAYLDPTSGSLAFQMAVGGFISAAAALRIYRQSLARFFRRAFRLQPRRG